MNTHIITFFDGASVLITAKQAHYIQQAILDGKEYIPINGNLVNRKNISRIGTHHATPMMNKERDSEINRLLTEKGHHKLLDDKTKAEYENAKRIINKEREKIDTDEVQRQIKEWNSQIDELPAHKMTAEESANGDAEYYVIDGQKYYS